VGLKVGHSKSKCFLLGPRYVHRENKYGPNSSTAILVIFDSSEIITFSVVEVENKPISDKKPKNSRSWLPSGKFCIIRCTQWLIGWDQFFPILHMQQGDPHYITILRSYLTNDWSQRPDVVIFVLQTFLRLRSRERLRDLPTPAPYLQLRVAIYGTNYALKSRNYGCLWYLVFCK